MFNFSTVLKEKNLIWEIIEDIKLLVRMYSILEKLNLSEFASTNNENNLTWVFFKFLSKYFKLLERDFGIDQVLT